MPARPEPALMVQKILRVAEPADTAIAAVFDFSVHHGS